MLRSDRLCPQFSVRVLGLAAAFLAAAGTARAQTTEMLEHQGAARTYIIAGSPQASPGPRPAFIALHGRRDPAAPNRSSPQLDALAAREGFVAVYPAAIAGKWNYVGEVGQPSRIGADAADDIGFLRRLIETLVARRIAEASQVYVSGVSQGGFMTWSVLCDLSDRVAAAAAMLASMTDRQLAGCKPARTVPTVVIAGTGDRVVRYDGWLASGDRLSSVPETLEHWRRQHGCTGQKESLLPRKDATQLTQAVLVEWTGCKVDGALRLYRIEGGGHVLPSLTPQTPEDAKRWGARSFDFETSEELWRFFRRFRLGPP